MYSFNCIGVRFFTLVFTFLSATIVLADLSPIPQFDDTIHLGVATCSGSACHGSSEPFKNSPVMQNEYIIWQKEDKHRKAYSVLLSKESKRIAKNLNLKNAHTAKLCLDCHADYVPEERRGRRFQLSDGVGCEACHGGAERYLGPHVSGRLTHQENIDNGLYPTENPIQRARLCLSCHFGTNNKFVTHKIMGAGHPRMSFELDTFTAIAPAHYVVDKDYAERKVVWSNARTWAIGQALALQEYLKQISRPKRLNAGVFPELVFFDCHACHHSLEDKRWAARSSTGLEPGVVRLNDSNLLMLRQIATVINPGLAKSLKQKTLALHKASTVGTKAIIDAANELKPLNAKLIKLIANTQFSKKTVKQVLANIVNEGISAEYRDYAAAEQSIMAIEALLMTLQNARAADLSPTSRLTQKLDALYKTLEKEYKPEMFVASLKGLKEVIK